LVGARAVASVMAANSRIYLPVDKRREDPFREQGRPAAPVYWYPHWSASARRHYFIRHGRIRQYPNL